MMHPPATDTTSIPSSPRPQSRQASGVTDLLHRWQDGDGDALDQLIPLVFAELRRLAGSYLSRENRGHTLQPTALVHELYLRLNDRRTVMWNDRSHFFGFAARTMRRILVDHARLKNAKKRAGGVRQVPLDDDLALAADPGLDVVALDAALDRLAELDRRQARVVELRFFVGLSMAEISRVLEVSPATVGRDWASARAWLFRELSAEGIE
jgi:RNA polymerase sigma factor (TIGR02999 family)